MVGELVDLEMLQRCVDVALFKKRRIYPKPSRNAAGVIIPLQPVE